MLECAQFFVSLILEVGKNGNIFFDTRRVVFSFVISEILWNKFLWDCTFMIQLIIIIKSQDIGSSEPLTYSPKHSMAIIGETECNHFWCATHTEPLKIAVEMSNVSI